MVLEKTLESPLDCKEIQPVRPKGESVLGVHWKDWCWSWNSNTLTIWCEELLIWKDPDAGKDWSQEKGNKRGWDGWMASPTQWAWVCTNSKRQWRTGKPWVLKFVGSYRVRHNLATEQHHFLLSSSPVYFYSIAHVGNIHVKNRTENPAEDTERERLGKIKYP